MNIGEKIHNIRKKNRISTSALANMVNVPKHIISAWESGDITPDSVEIKKIAQALNVSVDTLLDNTEYYNNTDLITNMYDDYKEKNNGKIIFLIITFIIVFFILGDTILALALKKSPFISWKVSYLSGDSYVDKGIFMDTYYCVKEKDIVTVVQKFKLSKFECPNIKQVDNKTNRKVKNIKDTSKDIENFKCSTAVEKFYEDAEYEYFLECTNSSYIIVTYYNDKTENIKSALEKGQITINDLDEYEIKYTKKALANPPKEDKPENPSNVSEKVDAKTSNSLTFYLHKNSENAMALETTFVVENAKVIAINTKTQARKEIFSEEPVQSIAARSLGNTGDSKLVILTTTGDVYQSSEINYNYEFGNELEIEKLDVHDIVGFKLEILESMGRNFIAIDSKGNEIYIK